MSKETIYRQDAIDAMCKLMNSWFGNSKDEQEEITWIINHLPYVQPYTAEETQKMADLEQAEIEKAFELGREDALSEIIRCKDCKWKQGAECVRFAEVRPFPDDFCSRAERREE